LDQLDAHRVRSVPGRWPGTVCRQTAVLDQIDLIELDPRIRILAQPVRSAAVLSRDVIHLGTALLSRRGLTSFVTEGKRLLDAARAAGLPVGWPD
jgi:uncharacterized protein